MQPLLTICVPTSNRPELARRVVSSLLAERVDGVSILVLENSDQPSLSVADFGNDPSVTISSTDKLIDMPANWERGLALADGRYVGYMADKDIVVPGALAEAVGVLARCSPDVVCYRKAVFDSENGLLFRYECTGRVIEVPTAPLLRSWCQRPRHIHSAPMIYNSFVSSAWVSSIRGRTGLFFIGSAPDVSSGMLIAAYLRSYLQLDRTLSVSYVGGWSNGAAFMRYGSAHPQSQKFIKAFRVDPFEKFGLPATVSSTVLEVLLSLKEAHTEAFAEAQVNWKGFLDVVHREVMKLQIPDDAKRRELAKLHGKRSVVPRKHRWAMLARHGLRRVLPSGLVAQGDRIIGRLAAARAAQTLRPDSAVPVTPPWHDGSYAHTSKVSSIEECITIVGERNRSDQVGEPA